MVKPVVRKIAVDASAPQPGTTFEIMDMVEKRFYDDLLNFAQAVYLTTPEGEEKNSWAKEILKANGVDLWTDQKY